MGPGTIFLIIVCAIALIALLSKITKEGWW